MLRNHIDDESLRKQGEALIEVIRDPPLSQVYIFGRGGHPALYLKARYPGKFYAGGYAPWTGDALGLKVDWPSYVSSLIDLGYDGVGEMGSKPVTRDKHTPLDSTYYEGLWESCESEKFPVLCHVGDVEDFWHQELTPEWAKVRGWGYWKDDYPAMEELWTEIENVLTDSTVSLPLHEPPHGETGGVPTPPQERPCGPHSWHRAVIQHLEAT
jgi:hypothetical protein